MYRGERPRVRFGKVQVPFATFENTMVMTSDYVSRFFLHIWTNMTGKPIYIGQLPIKCRNRFAYFIIPSRLPGNKEAGKNRKQEGRNRNKYPIRFKGRRCEVEK